MKLLTALLMGGAGDDRIFALHHALRQGRYREVNLYRGGDASATLRALGSEAAGPGNKEERYIDLPCGKNVDSQRNIFNAGFPAVGQAPVIYTEVTPDRKIGGVALSYWFWFTFNPGPPPDFTGQGEHGGDWEHLTVYLDRKGRPERSSTRPTTRASVVAGAPPPVAGDRTGLPQRDPT